jgi:hypothetical protein
MGDASRDLDHELGPQAAGQLLQVGAGFGSKDDLGPAKAIAQVDEQDPLVVPVTIDPAAQCRILSDMRDPQFAAGMRSQHRKLLTGLG